jgi:hypothetical protein
MGESVWANRLHAGLIASYGFAAMLQIYTQISIAVLALTVSKALLPGNSYNWLIALAMYFGLPSA